MEKENLRQNNIIWNLAVRDDEYVAKHVKDNKEMDAIYSLKEAGLLDEFFQFLQEMNIIELIKEVKYKDVQREMVEFFQYIFLYIPNLTVNAPILPFLGKGCCIDAGFR